MKRLFLALNILLMATLLCCVYIYRNIDGSLSMKSRTALCFVSIGLANVTYTACTHPRKLAAPLVLCFGLMLAMAGDLLLSKHFILGAGLFAAGHVLYAVAMYIRQRFALLDALMSGVVFLVALAVLTCTPKLTFSEPIFGIVCYAYAVIISAMAGKAISGLMRERTLANCLLALGGILFFFSDVMLVLNWFAGAGRWASTACLYTYFPGQGLLATSILAERR